MEAPGFLTKHPAGRWNQSLGPKPQLFLLCGEIVVVSRVGREGERARKKSVAAGAACLLFGEVLRALDWAWSPKQRWLGEDEPSLGPLARPGLFGPLAATVAVGCGAGQGGAPLQALSPEPLGCLCGCPPAFPLGRFPAPSALKRHQSFSVTWVVVCV